MQALRNALELVRTRLAGLPPSAKLLAGSLVVILALGLFLVAQWSASGAGVPFAVTPTAYEDAKRFLATRGVSYEERNGQLLVPAERHAELIAQFAETSGAAESGIDFAKLVELDSPFETTRQSETKKLIALQNVLAQTIAGFRNVKSARVFISPKSTAMIGARHQQTASVNVTMRQGGLSQEQVDAIASMVAGTQSGLKPESVAVTDGARLYRTSFGESAASGENLEQTLRIADAVHARIVSVLSWIDGVRIGVNPQVVTTERTISKTEFRDGVSVPLSESTSTSESRGTPVGREAGAVPNTGLSIVSTSGGASQTATERIESRYQSAIPGSQFVEKDNTGYATKIDVSVAVPRSYFVRVWQLRNPAAGSASGPASAGAAPDEAALAVVIEEELARIRRLVEPLAATDAIEGSKKGVVEVGWYPDFEAREEPPAMAAGLGELVLGADGSGGASGLIRPIGLGVLALVSLFFMLGVARRATRREGLPGAVELAGGVPRAEDGEVELVDDGGDAAPVLDGIELDDERLRQEQMLDQLNEMAARDPAELSGILRRWMRATA